MTTTAAATETLVHALRTTSDRVYISVRMTPTRPRAREARTDALVEPMAKGDT